jgi:predicted dithiol-disulfide oxidoreductase (DUF899 family)
VELPADLQLPPIVSPREWEAAHAKLLVKEKELTRARDALAAERRRMPRMAVEKDYRFEGPNGSVGLGDLFEGRHQLIVYRFFYEPGSRAGPRRAAIAAPWSGPRALRRALRARSRTGPALRSRAASAPVKPLAQIAVKGEVR